jgi:predicted phage terminase large subunit-like protein
MSLTAFEQQVWAAALEHVLPKPPTTPRFATPGDLAKAVTPDTIQTPALDLIDSALVDVEAGRCDRLMIFAPPQEGKSTRVTKLGPLWALTRNPDRRIVVVSYSAELANEFGRDIRNMITNNQGEDDTLDLGLRIAPDNGAVSSWKIAGRRGGVRSVGLTGGITGRPADWLFIDDPVANRERAESEAYRKQAKGFWTSTGSTRLAPGAPVVLVLTRWHEDDLAGWLLGREDGHRWRVINIPAQADHDPTKGETDSLGRQPGEYMQSARTNERTGKPRSIREWEQIRVQAGSRDWQALYQGRPAPPEGGLFKRDWWKYYEQPQWVERDNGAMHAIGFDELLISWDMAFKDLDSSDWVVGQVWARRGARAFLLDQVRRRMSFVETCAAVRTLAARWPQAVAKLVEDKANGTAVMNALARVVPGMIGVEPEGSKQARASAVSPFVEAGNVFLPAPELAPWIGDFVEEYAAFANGAHDDQVDAGSQGLNRLLLNPLLLDEDIYEDEDQYDAVGSISDF